MIMSATLRGGALHARRDRDGWGEEGFALVEVVVAITIFTILALAFMMTLLSAMGAYQVSRTRTLAEQVATEQVEQARKLPYDQLGTKGGNPPGTLDASRDVSVGAVRFTVRTRVSFVDDPLAGGFQTGANYKRLRVTVTKFGDSREFARLETQVAPPTQPALNKSLIRVQVVDVGNNTPVYGAIVDLRGGPDIRSDTSEPDGSVTFASLTPNPTSGPLAFYDLFISHPGYDVLREDRSPAPAAHVQVAPGQLFSTVLRVYRPATIDVQLVDGAGSPFSQPATVTVASSRGGATFPWAGGPLTITQLAGESVVPGIEYTVSATAPGGWYGTAVSQIVPRNYPLDLGSSFRVSLRQYPTARIEVQLRDAATLGPIGGARVDVVGGPGGAFVTGTTNPGGVVSFDVPAGSETYSVQVPPQGSYAAAQATAAVPGPGTTVVRVDVPR